MKWTRERKMYAAVLTLAAGALGVDQVMLSGENTGPAVASARVPGMSAGARPSAGAAAASFDVKQFDFKAVSLNRDNSLAFRLESLAESQQLALRDVTNPFEPSAQWQPKKAVVQAQAGAPAQSAHPLTKRKLLAVMTNARGGMAMIEGQPRPLQVGEMLDGLKLVSLDAMTATFEGESGEQVVLKLQLPGSGGTPAAGPTQVAPPAAR
jgi:hypothetical protein